MPVDKSLFFYGSLYHKYFDPSFQKTQQEIAGLIAEGSSVLDIACGTGQLCAIIAQSRKCRVTGIDLSLRMLDFARATYEGSHIRFLHADATDLREFADGSFDYACIALLLHELAAAKREQVLSEALRVAGRVIVVDACSPLPRSAEALNIRLAEATIGHSHHKDFLDYLARGGIPGMLDAWPAPLKIEHHSLVERDCRDLMMIARA